MNIALVADMLKAHQRYYEWWARFPGNKAARKRRYRKLKAIRLSVAAAILKS